MSPGKCDCVWIVVVLRRRRCFSEEPKHQNDQPTAHGEQKAGAPTVMPREVVAMLEPALKIPVAKARSFFGNHSETLLVAAGKLPDSPKPRTKRQAPKLKGLRMKLCAGSRQISRVEYRPCRSTCPRAGSQSYKRAEGTADFAIQDIVVLFSDFRQQDAEDNSIEVVDRSPEKEQRVCRPPRTD